VRTTGPAFHRDLDVLPDGRTALALQRPVTRRTRLEYRRNRLELRIGRKVRTLDFARHTFDSAAIDHDRRGRLIAAWAEPDGAGAVSTWIAGRGIQQIGAPGLRVTQLSLDVAADGYAVLAFGSYEGGIFVTRRLPRRDFSAAQMLSGQEPGFGLAAGVSSGGRAVVAWHRDRRITVRASDNFGPFGPLRTVELRTRARTLVAGTLELAITDEGRAVVAVSTREFGPGGPGEGELVAARVAAFDWSPRRPGPSPPRILSEEAVTTGGAEVLATGRAAIIAWTERVASNAPRTLRAVSWTARGPSRAHEYETRKLGIPVALTPARGQGAHVFYRVRGGRWYTVRLSHAGLFRNTTQVTPPSDFVLQIDVAGRGRRAAAAWTVRRGRTNASWRVQVARPR